MTIIYPTKDTYINLYYNTTNYVTANPLGISAYSHTEYSFLEFDLTGVGTISSCYFKFYATSVLLTSISNNPVLAKRCTTQQNLSSITWANNSTVVTDTNSASTPVYTPGGTWYSINIKNLVIDEATNTLQIRLQMTHDRGSSVDFTSMEGSSNKPYLDITYSTPTDYYVKTTGDDYKDGQSWANAWKTINQAANQTPDGSTLHIGHGNYNAEPAGNQIDPCNAGSLGIKYKPETADTGAEVAGTVTIEKN